MKYFIIALNKAHAERYAEVLGIDYQRRTYVQDSYMLSGLRGSGVIVLFCDGWQERHDARELMIKVKSQALDKMFLKDRE